MAGAASIPASVATIDAVLNHRVATSASDAEVVRWMSVKTQIKRRLAAVPDALLESEAVAAMVWLKEAV